MGQTFTWILSADHTTFFNSTYTCHKEGVVRVKCYSIFHARITVAMYCVLCTVRKVLHGNFTESKIMPKL